jgi:hypothetical protein
MYATAHLPAHFPLYSSISYALNGSLSTDLEDASSIDTQFSCVPLAAVCNFILGADQDLGCPV